VNWSQPVSPEPYVEPTTSQTCEPPSCIKFKSQGDADAILAWGIALLCLAIVLGLGRKKRS
jgi:hypothetical protein